MVKREEEMRRNDGNTVVNARHIVLGLETKESLEEKNLLK